MKACWGSGSIAPRILLTSALDGGEWSVSRPGHFTTRERAPGTHRIGGCVGPRAGLEAVMNRNSQPLPGFEPPIIQPSAIILSYPGSILKLSDAFSYRLLIVNYFELSVLRNEIHGPYL
jgi:hypothetical protein